MVFYNIVQILPSLSCRSLLLVPFLTLMIINDGNCFSVIHPYNTHRLVQRQQHILFASRSRSRVSDPAGPTPDVEQYEPETISLKDIPELEYDENAHPIPHQPWRRGITAGCEDPIDAEWRQEAEEVIHKAARMVGAEVFDVTWYLTSVLITIDENKLDTMPTDFLKASGPVIDVVEPEDPQFVDPNDPSPEDIWIDDDVADDDNVSDEANMLDDSIIEEEGGSIRSSQTKKDEDEKVPKAPGFDDEVVYRRDLDTEEALKRQMYARKEDDEEEMQLDEELPSIYMTEESRADEAALLAEEAALQYENDEKPVTMAALTLDTSKISTIAGAIIDALETIEDKVYVLARHEVVLAGTKDITPVDFLETQKHFDTHHGVDVAVETQDPWNSNRTIRGKLVDRNSMDIILNQKGRMVTIPQNFVKCVRFKRNSESIFEDEDGNQSTTLMSPDDDEYDIYED